MKILVCVKRVLDYNIKARVKADGSDVDLNNQKMSINPFDEIALEEAVRLKEAGKADEIHILAIGSKLSNDTIRTGLALGGDQGILVECNQPLPPLTCAKVIARIAKGIDASLVIMGKQAIDNDFNQTGQMLAGILDWSQATFISKCQIDGQQVLVSREVDGGIEELSVTLPAVLTTDLRLNTPRYPKLPNIMKAKQKVITTHDFNQLGIAIDNNFKVLKVAEPLPRAGGKLVKDVDELIQCLRTEAKVI